MSYFSSIEWTSASWNPVTGCSKISPGCRNCYAERLAIRLKAMGSPNYRNGFKVTIHEHMLNEPMKWKKPSLVFVNSMSDLFHNEVPETFIYKIFKSMRETMHHQYQILTKRSDRLLKLDLYLQWQTNIWMGVTVENKDYIFRIEDLKQTNACVKFISFEPLLGLIPDIDLKGIDWVIAGGESGIGARPVEEEWVKRIRNICQEQNIPFFFKQWGGLNKKKNGRELDGKTWNEMPDIKHPFGEVLI